ncbi:MAG: response regulator, partial [SAR324 cluster bacterium]|nr:response regulator [SAR324 cluster bacterium]
MPINEQHQAIQKILIVDDFEDNCLLIKDHLRNQIKCEFREASSGIAALKILENWCPDCILMDIMMPEMDGVEATKRLKSMPKCQDIPVLMVTAKHEIDS